MTSTTATPGFAAELLAAIEADRDDAFVDAVAAAIGSTGDLGPDRPVNLAEYLAAFGEPDDSFPFGPSARELRFAMA